MRKLAGIVESPVAPPVNMLWLHKGELRYFNGGEWVLLNEKPEKIKIPRVTDIYKEYVKQGGFRTLEGFAKELVKLVDNTALGK